MQMIEVKHIDWDLDGLKPHECGVPTNLIMPAREVFSEEVSEEEYGAASDEVVDYLSDEYGYCINNCDVSFFFETYKQRCQDCMALVADDDGDWSCDEAGCKCKEVDRCPEGL